MFKNNFNLDKKHSLITGAAGLLGEQHAIALLEINSNIILTDINFKRLIILKKKLTKMFPESKILIFRMDVSKEKSIIQAANKLKKRNIKINILINNAAIDSKINKNKNMTNSSKFEKLDINDWNDHLDVGLKGAMLCSKIFGVMMIKNNTGGVILNVASDLSVIAPNHSIYKKGVFKPIMYSVIKHSLIGLTKYLATYWALNNIRCNAISPGPVLHDQDNNFIKKIKKHIPLNRLAKPEEYKSAIQFLCTDASSYMTGQNIVIDGGRSVW